MTESLICPVTENPCGSRSACAVRGCWREARVGGAPDPIVSEVVNRLRARSEAGMLKYGTGLDRADLGLVAWLTHLQEELLDAACYVERLRSLLEGRKG